MIDLKFLMGWSQSLIEALGSPLFHLKKCKEDASLLVLQSFLIAVTSGLHSRGNLTSVEAT